jgi:hypothetical protein
MCGRELVETAEGGAISTCQFGDRVVENPSLKAALQLTSYIQNDSHLRRDWQV